MGRQACKVCIGLAVHLVCNHGVYTSQYPFVQQLLHSTWHWGPNSVIETFVLTTYQQTGRKETQPLSSKERKNVQGAKALFITNRSKSSLHDEGIVIVISGFVFSCLHLGCLVFKRIIIIARSKNWCPMDPSTSCTRICLRMTKLQEAHLGKDAPTCQFY